MNFFLAFVIFTILFVVGTSPIAIVDKEGVQSQLLPSAQEAIENGYLTHSGLVISSIPGSIAALAGVGSGYTVASIDGKIPKTPQDIIDVIKKGAEFTLTIETI